MKFLLTSLVAFIVCSCVMGNCGIGSACDGCQHYKDLLVNGRNIRVCCKSCSKYFTAGFFDEVNKRHPYCTCQFDRFGGTCWKGDQCASCDPGYVGNINNVPVCCANCERRGLIMSPTSCHCNNK